MKSRIYTFAALGFLAIASISTLIACHIKSDSSNYPTMKQCMKCNAWYPMGGSCPNRH
ncbi:MAG: hypothetical protein NT065_06020 [Chlamydiae bacterium]|nr:hypothetical protein [Chlamydiota bacterium]